MRAELSEGGRTVCRQHVVALTEDLKKRAQHRLKVMREDKRQARKQHDAERKSYGQCKYLPFMIVRLLVFLFIILFALL